MLIITTWGWPRSCQWSVQWKRTGRLQWSLLKKLGHSEVQPEFTAAAVSQARGAPLLGSFAKRPLQGSSWEPVAWGGAETPHPPLLSGAQSAGLLIQKKILLGFIRDFLI